MPQAAVAVAAETPADPKSRPQLHQSRFALAEHKRNVYFVTPVQGTTLAEVLEPAYWAHVAHRLRPTDRVEVHAEDGSWFATLYVRDAGRLYAKLVPIQVVEFEDKPETVPVTGHEVQWKGPHHRWSVIRLADNQPVKTGCASRDDAMAWLATNAKTLTA